MMRVDWTGGSGRKGVELGINHRELEGTKKAPLPVTSRVRQCATGILACRQWDACKRARSGACLARK